MLISVIVPVYNTEKYLDRCIQSILGQTYSNIELLLIDDGSMDSSGEICDKYAQQDSRVRVFHKENGGASAARNMGLDNARGLWIAFVDSDDWIDPEMYSEMYSLAVAESVDAVYCDIMFEDVGAQSVYSYNNKFEDHQLMQRCLVPIHVQYFSMCNKLIAKRVFESNKIRAVEGANMWEDVELAIKVRYFVNSSKVINKPYYHYNQANITSTTHSKRQILIDGQIERVKQIEVFFVEQGAKSKYKHFISLLKLHVKDPLFENGLYKQWLNVYTEANFDVWKLKSCYSFLRLLQFCMVIYGGNIGIMMLRLYKSIKSTILNKARH